MGNKRRTVAGLMVWKVVPKFNLLYCKGSIPGVAGCEVRVRDSICRKQEIFRASTPLPFPTCLPGDPLYDTEEDLLCPAASVAAINLRTGREPPRRK